MSSEDNKADCPQCLKLEEKVGDFERVPRLDEPGKVKGWEGMVHETPFKHIVDAGNLLAPYTLTQLIDCSRDAHPHKSGYVVRTRCGQVLRLGWKCASNAVSGWEAALEHHVEREKHFNRVNDIKRIPEECLPKLKWLAPLVRKYAQYQKANLTTARGREMARRARAGAKGAEIILVGKKEDPNTGRVRTVESRQELRGLQFWTTSFDPRIAESYLEEAESLLDLSRSFDPKSEAEVRDLHRKCRGVEQASDSLEKKVMLGQEFFSERNTLLVAEAMRMHARN